MIMNQCFSEIGRTTHQHLNNLRRQLGTGVDPAFDYSTMLELQKKLAQAGKQGMKQRADRLHGEGSSAPASGLDLLKRTLKEVVGVGAGLEDADSDQAEAAASHRRARSTPADIREQREKGRNTSAFKSSTRDSLKKLDIENRFRAPPIGSYRPKDDMMIPKQPCYEFGGREETKSLKTIAVEKEIERLQDEGQDFAHLTMPATTIELQEGIPSRPPDRMADYSMAKDLNRPDMMKLANIQYHDNSFTAGVLDGKDRTSQYPRLPSWDFAKISTAPDKPREYYFQPGQYPVKWAYSKSKQDVKLIEFEKQIGHKPLKECVNGKEIQSRPTLHLPDRSLSRPSCIPYAGGEGGCQPLQRRVKDIAIGKCTTRKPPYEYVPPMYDTSDPRIEEQVLNTYNSFDAFEAMRPTKTRLKPAEDFKKSLTRQQHHRTMRYYASDRNLMLMKNALTSGPVSVETLPMDAIDDHPSLQRRVIGKDLKTMAGREVTKDYIELPPRGQIEKLEGKMNFGRGTRNGDSRAETGSMSKLAGAITELRGSRSYDALPRQDHPRPSVDAS